MASVLDNAPATLAEKAESYKKMSERELLAVIAENSRRTKGYVQAISILVLLNICAIFALVVATMLQAH